MTEQEQQIFAQWQNMIAGFIADSAAEFGLDDEVKPGMRKDVVGMLLFFALIEAISEGFKWEEISGLRRAAENRAAAKKIAKADMIPRPSFDVTPVAAPKVIGSWSFEEEPEPPADKGDGSAPTPSMPAAPVDEPAKAAPKKKGKK